MFTVPLNMLNSLKPFQCPNCNSSYCSKDGSRFHAVTRYPRVLPCGHSVCEHCLQAAEKKQSTFTCSICNKVVKFTEDETITKFLPDVHALGIISANLKNSLPSLKVRMVPSSDIKRHQSQEESFRKTGSSITCAQCKDHLAFWQCDDCQLKLCSLCFKEIHSAKSKKRHEGKKIFAELYNSMVQEGCHEHENKTIEFYCEVDNELTCSFCMLMGKHVGHEVKTLVDKNKACAEDLKNTLKETVALQKRLKYTDHVLCEVIPKEKVDVSSTIKEIHDYFHNLHVALQLREAELLSEITDISERNVKSLEEMRLKVTSYERDLASLRKDAESVIENPCLAVSAPAILKRLEDTTNLPCYLVPVVEDTENTFNLDIDLESDLEEKIKQFGRIHFGVKSRYALLPSHELPSDFNADIPDTFDCKIPDLTDSETGTTMSFDTFSEDSLSVTADRTSHSSSLQASFKSRDFSRMQPEKVLVSYIKSPSKFFIQRCSELRKLKSLSEAIDRWCKTPESKKTKVSTVETGSLYLVRFKKDNKWYRGRVKKIIVPEDNECTIGTKMLVTSPNGHCSVGPRELKAEVYYVDFGNTDIVSLSDIKHIQTRFLNFPNIAKECNLVDIEPSNGDEWCSEAINSFTNFVANKPVIMQICEEMNNILSVDLCQAADNNISNDVPVSVRDALVFLDYAVFPSGCRFTNKQKKSERKYMPPEPLRMNANICAIVSHVESPSHIYVQQMSTASYLSTLIFEMNETYNDEKDSMLHNIFVPYDGMICAAQFTVDKQWYRAIVTGLPGGAKVKVQYVDFGNSEVIHHKQLRKLQEKYYKLNIQAIPCKLAHVSYNQEKGWTPGAKQWLTDEVSRKQLTLKSLGNSLGENKAEVVLYYVKEDTEICINALMVEKGFAASTGEFSEIVRKKKEGSSKSPKFSNQCISLVPIVADIPAPVATSNVPSEETLSERGSGDFLSPSKDSSKLMEKSPVKTASPARTKYPSLASTVPEGSGHIEVHVSHIETPGSFYIRIAGENEKKLTRIMNDLQKTYEDYPYEAAEYSVGKAYAVYSVAGKKWFRGTVLEKISTEKVKIHYVDYGNSEEVEIQYLRKLSEKFSVEESFSVRCHLDGIVPAGGSSKWPHSAKDFFVQLVMCHDTLLLSSKGEFEKETKSLPVDLLLEELIRGGALEATKVEYTSITDEILKRGYALPIRRRNNADSNKEAPKLVLESKTEEVKSVTPVCDPIVPSFPHPNAEIGAQPTEVDVEELPPQEPTFQWKPAIPPLDSTFKGYVTNVGDDGSIHLYVVIEGGKSSQVELIRSALQFRYAKLKSAALTKAPPIGEAVISKFPIDKQWYRAEILSVYPDRVKVNYVDYGNNEVVSLSDIRTDIMMRDFPRQCLECALVGIAEKTVGKWDDDLLTFLHTQLVESQVSVEVQGPPDNQGRLQCNITTSSGISVSELLINMGFGSESITEPEPEPSDKVKSFASAMQLRKGDILPVCVTQIASESIVYIQVLPIANPKDLYESEHNEVFQSFLQVITELRETAKDFPKLKSPMPGMPCCAQYSYDNDWYRCEVTDLTPNGAVVLYVDYGNSEEVSLDNLRELQPKFVDFPVQVHFCELYDMKPVNDAWDPEVRKILTKTLLVPEKELFAKVIVSGKISQVDILTKTDDGKLKLAYEELTEKKLVSSEKANELNFH